MHSHCARLGLGQWLWCRPVKQQLVSAWVRTPSPTADHFHSPPVVWDWVIKGVGWTPPASVSLEVRRTGNIPLLFSWDWVTCWTPPASVPLEVRRTGNIPLLFSWDWVRCWTPPASVPLEVRCTGNIPLLFSWDWVRCWTPPASVPLEVRRTGNIPLLGSETG